MANNNKQMVDLPFFELCNQAPVATTALSALAASEDGSDRYIYYLSTSAFYKYDKIADTWFQLANPITAPVTVMSMRYTTNRGFHGRVISATSTSVTIPGLRNGVFDGEKLRILQGTGYGQERTLDFVSDTIHDTGVVTAVVAGNAGITDNLKKWRVNQWAGYTLGITFSTGVTQYKEILYNDATTLYVYDANLIPHDPWNNYPYTATAPYALPAINASHYKIISSTYNVDTPWSVTPNENSFFTTLTGGIYLVSSAAATPFFTFQYYDIANDIWQVKTTPQGFFTAALGTDATIERTSRIGIALTTNVGITTALSDRTLQDLGQNLTPDRYANYRVQITGGTGMGQSRRIVGHTTNTYTIPRNWDVLPNNTSTYSVWADYDRVYLAPGGLSSLLAYSPENDYWMQGQAFDDGITNNISATLSGWVPFGVTSGAIIAAGIRGINSTPTAGGTGYAIGDVAVCNVGGTGAQVRVTSIAPGGIVTGIELIHSGTATGFTIGTGRATTQTGGLGSGSGLTIEITSVGETALITTASAHFLKTGNVITFAGCTNSSWNASYTILGVPNTAAVAPTTFCVVSNVGSNMAATASQSTSVIVDPTKNWVVNEHVGRLVHLTVAGFSPTSQVRWITANTANTITIQGTITAGVNGTSKYVIYDSKIFGIGEQRKEDGKETYGYATGGSTTTLVDSTKSWIPNQWANYHFKVEGGTGYGSGRILITSNTETTLTYTAQTFTPDSTTKYDIADCWGLSSSVTANTLTDANKAWATNQFIQKRVRVTSSTLVGTEATASANTATGITATIGTPDANTSYAIIGCMTRGAGIELIHNVGSTNLNIKGRYLITARGGGSNGIEIYDIPSARWITPDFTSPQSELFTTGSSYAYDGEDLIYMARSAANLPIRIMSYNINTNKINGAATTTFLQGTAHVGNLMEVLTTPTDGFKYLYILQNTGTLMARALLF